MKEKRIGIFGGTFNPIHIGHLAIAEVAQEKCGLDEVVFVPSYQPPHKTISYLAPAKDRYRMVRLAVEGHSDFSVSDCEIKRKGRSFTIDTVRDFRKRLPKSTQLFFIIGGDSFPDLSLWKEIDALSRLVTFIVVNRPGYRLPKGRRGIKYTAVVMPGIDLSSSHLRQRITERKSVKYFVPDKVLQYIKRQKLYQRSGSRDRSS